MEQADAKQNLNCIMRNLLDRVRTWLSSPQRLRMSVRDRILLLKRMALYLRAGIPIVEALGVIQSSSGSSSQKRLLRILMVDIQSGNPLSRAFARFPRIYASTHLQLIAVGEASGTLPDALFSLAKLLDDRARRIRSIIGSLAYPAVLFVAALGISLFLILYVFPKIIPIFRGLHAQLPFTTRSLIWLSSFIQSHWLVLLLTLVLSAAVTALTFRTERARKYLDSFMLRLPFFGKILRSFIIVSIFRTLSTLLSTGMRLDESILLAQNSIANTSYRAALEDIRETVLAGNTLSTVFSAKSFLFPPLALQLASVGEMTGTLSDSIGSAAEVFEEELSDQLRLLSSVLEPLIMTAMGLIIGFIALAIISPMYGITQNLNS